MGEPGSKDLRCKYTQTRAKVGVLQSTSIKKFPLEGTTSPSTTQTNNFQGRYSNLIKQRSHRGSPQSKFGRVLLHFIPQEEAFGRMEANHRPKSLKQHHNKSHIQDGVGTVHPKSDGAGTVGLLHRSYRCLFPYTHKPDFQKIPKVCHRGDGIPIPSSTVRISDRTSNLHKSHVGNLKDTQERRSHNAPVLGRLAPEARRPGIIILSDSKNFITSRTDRACGQSTEVRADTNTEIRICRNIVRPGERSSLSPRKESTEDQVTGTGVHGSPRIGSREVVMPDRTLKLSHGPSPSRTLKSETPAISSQRKLANGQELSRSTSSHTSTDKGPPPLVDPIRCPNNRCPTSRKVTSRNDIHRCVTGGLGSPLEWERSVRPVGTRNNSSHQYPRDESSSSSSTALSPVPQEQDYPHCNRQHDSSVLHQPSGRNQVSLSNAGDNRTFQPGVNEQHHSKSSTYPRQIKCSGGSLKQSEPDPPDRVVTTPSSSRNIMDNLVETNGGPLCHKGQRQTTIIREPHSGRIGFCNRRPVSELGESTGIRLSSYRIDSTGHQENQGTQVQNHTSSPTLAREAVVSRVAPAPSVSTLETTGETRPPETTTQAHLSLESDHAQPTRMEHIKQAVVDKGFSEKVANFISGAVTASSRKVYQARWQYFDHWMREKNLTAAKATIQEVADFLLHLQTDKNSSISTIKGYRTAIAKVLLYTSGTDLSSSSVLSDLIKALEHKRPQLRNRFPKWDLTLVLNSLMEAPFEPLGQSSLKHLTQKTVFLLWLASGARRSEIHALDIHCITQLNNWQKVRLAPNPNFLAKNFNYSTGQRNFEGFTIESLKDKLGPGLEKDYSLCPVRALRYYLDRSKPLRGESSQLFISINNKQTRGVCKNTLASWVKAVILQAYKDAPLEVRTSLKVSSHEIRALATSTAFYGNTSMDDILQAGRWANQSTFTGFYLRDVAADLEGIYRLGPILAAQTIVAKPP